MAKKRLSIFTDGGSRGNPGPGAIGVVIKDDQRKNIKTFSKFLGKTTNNVAEYLAVIEAMKWLKENTKVDDIDFNFSIDSKLVVNQLNGFFKIKKAKLIDLVIQVRILEKEIGGRFIYRFIPRHLNKEADRLVNQELNKNIF
jgi:ribonuclease HI